MLKKFCEEWVQMFRESKDGVVGFYWIVAVIVLTITLVQALMGCASMMMITIGWIFIALYEFIKNPIRSWKIWKKQKVTVE